MRKSVEIVHYWGGLPQMANSKWLRFLRIIEGCRRRGWHCVLVWSRMPEDPALWRPFTDAGCRILLVPRPRANFDPEGIRNAYRVFRRTHCRLLHCHNVHTSPLIAAALAGVPVRLWSKLSMSQSYEQGIAPTGVHRLAPSIRISGCLAHRVLALTPAVRDDLISLGVPKTKILIVPGPVDLSAYAGTPQSGFRESLGLHPAQPLITTVGRAVPLKGWDLLIRAFDRVAREQPQARLALVGSLTLGDEIDFARRLRSLAAELNLSDKVFFLGPRSDIPRILGSTDVFCFPTRSDGQGLALTEALAARLPCVAARAGGVGDVICHRVNGLLFERDDAAGLAANLLEVMADAGLNRRLRENAFQSARRFDLATITEQVLDLYETLLERREKGS